MSSMICREYLDNFFLFFLQDYLSNSKFILSTLPTNCYSLIIKH